MRLTYIVEAWGQGGTERYIRLITEELSKLDHEISIVLLKGDLVDLPWCGAVRSLESDQSDLKCFSLTEIIAELDTQVVHLHLYTSMLSVVRKLKASSELPIVATWHSPLKAWNLWHRVKQVLALRTVDVAIGGSQATARELQLYRKGVNSISPPIMVGANGFRVARKDTLHLRIVGCGRLSSEKRWGDMIEALKLVCNWNVRLVIDASIYGEGSEREYLERLAQTCSQSVTVSLPGHLPSRELMEQLAGADLFILPSKFEGFGMAAAEAMSMGLPIIISDYPASEEYLCEGVNGHRFPAGNITALAEWIQWHYLNPQESCQIGQRARITVEERYNPKCMADEHLQLYSSLLSNRP